MNPVIENAALVVDVTNHSTHAESSIERFPTFANPFTGRNVRVILRSMKPELSREPSNISDRARDARSQGLGIFSPAFATAPLPQMYCSVQLLDLE